MSNKTIKIFITATEQSGDNLGSGLLKYLKINSNYNFEFYGIGGDKMINEGLKVTNHLSDFKSIGFFELIKNLQLIYKILINNVKEAINFKPNLVITIDSPDFSFRFVKKLINNKLKSKYIHYVAPTVWAWRPKRAKYISNYYDLLLTIIPFEEKYFEKYGLKTVFVGNQICNNLNDIFKSYNKDHIAFLPGSRIGEVKSLLPYFKIMNEHIHKNYKEYKIFIPTLPHLINDINGIIKTWKYKPILIDNKSEINKFYQKCKFSIVCSGTAALELSSKKIPIIVIYKLNIFTEIIFSFLVNVKFANLINIIANKEIIPELVNHKLNSKKLINKFDHLIMNKTLMQNQIIEAKKTLKLFCLDNNSSYNASIEILKFI